MHPARRTALVSVVAAAFLIALKLGAGIASNSLGFISEAAHSGTDLVAALLTFLALGVATRPADATHAWGHEKAEHLAALAECAILALVSLGIGAAAVHRLLSDTPPDVEVAWWSFAVLGIVIAVDLARAVVSHRGSRRHGSPALAANALHFAGDLLGTTAVLIGLILTGAGVGEADAVAALFVAALVLLAAAKLARTNVDVLMDHTPVEADRLAREAIARLAPAVTLERLRIRRAAGRHFADVVVAVSPSAALAEGHAAADAVEAAVVAALPDSDVVVHVEPGHEPSDLRERALTAALGVPGVREIHNVRVLHPPGRTEVSLHVKLPARIDLASAHAVADAVETAIRAACPAVDDVATHLEPLDDPAHADLPGGEQESLARTAVTDVVREVTGRGPTSLRMVATDQGVVAFVSVALDGARSLAEAHEAAGTIRSRLRRDGRFADVFVHTEPA